MEQAIKVLQHNLQQKKEQIVAAKAKLQQLTFEEGEIIKTITSLQQFCSNSSSTTTTWADQVEEEENADSKNSAEKEVLKQTPRNKDPIEDEFGSKSYVIFDGPMKGVYSKWSIAKQHIVGHNVRHKSYKTLEEAKKAFDGAYREISTSKDIKTSGTMVSQRKLSIDKIRNINKKEDKTTSFDDFIRRWSWLTDYKEEYSLECFYPYNQNGCAKAITFPGIDKELLKSFFNNGMLHTVYLKEAPEKTYMELQFLPKEVKEVAARFNRNFAKGREIFLQFSSTYPYFDNDEVIQEANHLIKIGISNGAYPKASTFECTYEQISVFCQTSIDMLKVSRRLGSTVTRFRVLAEGLHTVIFSDFTKEAKEKDIEAILNFETTITQKVGENLPLLVAEGLCKEFRKFKGHACKICVPIEGLSAKTGENEGVSAEDDKTSKESTE